MNIQTQLTVRAQQMFALIEKYLASGLSQKAFCEQESLAFTTALIQQRTSGVLFYE